MSKKEQTHRPQKPAPPGFAATVDPFLCAPSKRPKCIPSSQESQNWARATGRGLLRRFFRSDVFYSKQDTSKKLMLCKANGFGLKEQKHCKTPWELTSHNNSTAYNLYVRCFSRVKKHTYIIKTRRGREPSKALLQWAPVMNRLSQATRCHGFAHRKPPGPQRDSSL